MRPSNSAHHTKLLYNFTTAANNNSMDKTLIASPIKNVAAVTRLLRAVMLKRNANKPFGTKHTKPPNSAEIAACCPPNQAAIKATKKVAAICNKTIRSIFKQDLTAGLQKLNIISGVQTTWLRKTLQL
jgi:hypothetical protein